MKNLQNITICLLAVVVCYVVFVFGGTGIKKRAVTQADVNWYTQRGNNIIDNKCIADGVMVNFTNKVITGINRETGYIYIQDDGLLGSSSGIMVMPDYLSNPELGEELAVGKVIDLYGVTTSSILDNNSGRLERYINGAYLNVHQETKSIRQIYLSKVSDVGGKAICVGTPGEVMDVLDADSVGGKGFGGLNTVGMRVKMIQKITYIGTNRIGNYGNVFYIGTVGQNPNTPSGAYGVMVKVPHDLQRIGPDAVRVGSYVQISGVVETNPIFSWMVYGHIPSNRYIEMFSMDDLSVLVY